MNLFSPDSNLVNALNLSSDLIAISNFDSYFTQLNKKWEEVTGYTIEELTSRPLFEFIHPEDRRMSQNEAEAMYNGQPETIKFENRYIKKNGDIIWLEWNSVIDYDLQLSFSIARDITDYKIATEFGNQAKELMTHLVAYANELPEKSEYLRYVLDKLLNLYQADCISFWDYEEADHSIRCSYSSQRKGIRSRLGLTLAKNEAEAYFSAIFHNNLVIAPEVLINPNTKELKSYFEQYKVTSLLDGIVSAGLNKCFLCIESGSTRNWTNQESNTLLAISNIISNFLNSQLLRLTNDELRAALDEKNILFRELHHRIKNNLNMVGSLLSLKSRITKNEELLEFIKETKNRIFSISKTHDQLLKLEELDQLNIREYVIDLIDNVILSYASNPDLYTVKDSIENQKVDVEMILSIGLLTNEIVSNIIKYAYDPKIGGEIIVNFEVRQDHFLLQIGDRGKGISQVNGDSLGLTLIDLLVKQINGTIQRMHSSGVEYSITIPLDEGKKSSY